MRTRNNTDGNKLIFSGIASYYADTYNNSNNKNKKKTTVIINMRLNTVVYTAPADTLANY